MSVIAYLSLGSNVGDSHTNLKHALQGLDQSEGVTVTRASSIYETDPVGVTDQDPFLNSVLEVRTILSAQSLLQMCLKIEEELGRKRVIRWGPRIIDLDVILYNNNSVVQSESLVIPHPRMHERSFVLIPLLEINSTLIHPVLNQPIKEIQALLLDSEGVRIWKRNDEQSVEGFLGK